MRKRLIARCHREVLEETREGRPALSKEISGEVKLRKAETIVLLRREFQRSMDRFFRTAGELSGTIALPANQNYRIRTKPRQREVLTANLTATGLDKGG